MVWHYDGVVEKVAASRSDPSDPGGRYINAGTHLVFINAVDELDAFVTVTQWLKERQDDSMGSEVQP